MTPPKGLVYIRAMAEPATAPESPESPPEEPTPDPPGADGQLTFEGGPMATGGAPMGSLVGEEPPAETPAEAPPQEPAAEPAPEADPSAERVAHLERQLEQSNRLLEQVLGQRAGDGQPGGGQATKPKTIGLDELIERGKTLDPLADPQAVQDYLTALPQALRAEIQQAETRARSEITEEQLGAELWSQFRTKYEDVSHDPGMARAAFNVVADEMGLKQLPRDPAQASAFLDKIASRLRGARKSDPSIAPQATPSPARAPAEPARTAGIAGGSSAAAPSASRSGGEGEGGEVVPFTRQIQKHQPAGFF